MCGSGSCPSASCRAGAVAGFMRWRGGFGAVMPTAVRGWMVVCRSMSVQGESAGLHDIRRAHSTLQLEHVKAVSNRQTWLSGQHAVAPSWSPPREFTPISAAQLNVHPSTQQPLLSFFVSFHHRSSAYSLIYALLRGHLQAHLHDINIKQTHAPIAFLSASCFCARALVACRRALLRAIGGLGRAVRITLRSGHKRGARGRFLPELCRHSTRVSCLQHRPRDSSHRTAAPCYTAHPECRAKHDLLLGLHAGFPNL